MCAMRCALGRSGVGAGTGSPSTTTATTTGFHRDCYSVLTRVHMHMNMNMYETRTLSGATSYHQLLHSISRLPTFCRSRSAATVADLEFCFDVACHPFEIPGTRMQL